MHPAIPLSLLRDLRCRHCTKFVTCGPVHVVPDGSILCGRCRALAKPKFQNLAYEALASQFDYPCCNWSKHCNKRLAWNESIDHERDCVFNSTCRLLCSRPGALCQSERKLPEGGDLSLQHVTEEILDMLKCVACESYLSCDPVFIGIDGRNICHRCVTSNGTPKGVIRNLSYERVATIFIFPCIYRFRGCTLRLKYGREMWQHEAECSYGQVFKKAANKTSKDGKERGVIETHSGHVYGTITPHSALFAPPKNNKNDDAEFNQELANVMKRKHHVSPSFTDEEPKTPDLDRHQSFDSQSMESMFDQSVRSSMTRKSSPVRRGADDAPNDQNYPGYAHEIPRVSIHHKRSNDGSFNGSYHQDKRDENLNDNGYYQDNLKVSDGHQRRSTDESVNSYPPGYFQDPRTSVQSKPSSRPPTREEDNRRPSSEVFLPATPPASSMIPHYGYYQENMQRWSKPQNPDMQSPHLYHFPPMSFDENYDSPNVKSSPSFNYPPRYDYHQQVAKRSESLRVGNKEIIEELKARQNRQKMQNEQNALKKDDNPYSQCNSLQDIVQVHDEVSDD